MCRLAPVGLAGDLDGHGGMQPCKQVKRAWPIGEEFGRRKGEVVHFVNGGFLIFFEFIFCIFR